MSDSILFYRDLGDTLYVIDPDALTPMDDIELYMDIILAVIEAGYDGVCVDVGRRVNGPDLVASYINPETIEGRLISELNGVPEEKLPTPQSVVDKIRVLYELS